MEQIDKYDPVNIARQVKYTARLVHNIARQVKYTARLV